MPHFLATLVLFLGYCYVFGFTSLIKNIMFLGDLSVTCLDCFYIFAAQVLHVGLLQH